MNNLNEELAFMAALCDRIKWDLFDLQHIRVDYQDEIRMNQLKQQMIHLSGTIHLEYDRIKEKFREQLPDIKEYIAEKPLRTSEDALTRMRKFDGRDDKIDLIDH